MRIASVLPSATEIVAALGAAEELVARSAECDHPGSVRALPVLMRARTPDRGRRSGEIDRQVLGARRRGESLYEIDTEVLAATRPQVLFTQDLCGVCSVTGAEVAAACRAAGVHPKIVSLQPRTLEEVWATVSIVGKAIGRTAEARALTEELRDRTAPSHSRGRSSIAVVEWLDPPILAGLWTPDIVLRAGGMPLGPASGEPGRRTTWGAIGSLSPALTILSPCSFPVERTVAELRSSGTDRALREAIGPARVVVADEAYFSRPGPRLAAGVELLRTLLASPSVDSGFPMPVVALRQVGPEASA